MADKTPEDSQETQTGALDLNALSGLDFGPSWADETNQKSRSHPNEGHFKSRGEGTTSAHRTGKGRRDRRQKGSAHGSAHASSDKKEGYRARSGAGGPRVSGQQQRDARHSHRRETFEPIVQVDLYPQDEAFDALVKRLQATARTYELFEIAHLLLEKPERFVVVVTPKGSAKGKGQATSTGEAPRLYYSVPGHLPFETEDEAINHVLSHHLEHFFDKEAIEVEAPKGNFQMVNKCGLTGELLGPPNYHRYQEYVQRHYANKISGMSYDRYTSKIEAVKDQESIDAWLEQMKQGARYTLKERNEADPESFESLEAVRHFLLQHRKDKVVASGASVRFAGRDIERMPKGDLRRSVEAYVQQQLHFPLDSANNIRGRLRRHKFTVYKKGSKGVSYVCAVKRKFRDSRTVFTDSIQQLMDFLEKNPEVYASQLSKRYLDIDIEKQTPEKLAMVTENQDSTAQTHDGDTKESVHSTEDESGEMSDAAPVDSVADPAPVVELAEADQARLKQMMIDLRWLIMEGYVTEYGDGRLFAPPPMPEPKKKAAEAVNHEAESVSAAALEAAVKSPEVAVRSEESNKEASVADAQTPDAGDNASEAVQAVAESDAAQSSTAESSNLPEDAAITESSDASAAATVSEEDTAGNDSTV